MELLMDSKISSKFKMDRPKKMVSLFAGIGGFDLAFNSIGVHTVLLCEIDEIAQHILKANLPKIKLVGDIRDLEKLPKCTDILCAGFPCQDLSTIGIKKGLSGKRSSLIREVFRLLEDSPVEWIVIENVTNMLHLHKGETIQTIVDGLEKLGYNWAYRTIDSMAFVPQHRCRVYILASLHHNPNNVILSNNFSSNLEDTPPELFTDPIGFYWTEGKYAIGLYKNGIPTLKCGSTIGIPSAPAIAFPNGNIGCPDIRDAERFQGFPEDWTKPAEDIAKPSLRWKLVGNAVTVNTVAWIAQKIIHPQEYDFSNDKKLRKGTKWPSAAWGMDGKRYISSSTLYPVEKKEIQLTDFLKYPCKPLSLKAAQGFEHRLNIGTVKCPQYFKDTVHHYVISKLKEHE